MFHPRVYLATIGALACAEPKRLAGLAPDGLDAAVLAAVRPLALADLGDDSTVQTICLARGRDRNGGDFATLREASHVALRRVAREDTRTRPLTACVIDTTSVESRERWGFLVRDRTSHGRAFILWTGEARPLTRGAWDVWAGYREAGLTAKGWVCIVWERPRLWGMVAPTYEAGSCDERWVSHGGQDARKGAAELAAATVRRDV
jgi:hypothetical protein